MHTTIQLCTNQQLHFSIRITERIMLMKKTVRGNYSSQVLVTIHTKARTRH